MYFAKISVFEINFEWRKIPKLKYEYQVHINYPINVLKFEEIPFSKIIFIINKIEMEFIIHNNLSVELRLIINETNK